MQELEKILEEIDEIKVGFDTECRSECDLFDLSCGACVGECDEYIKERAKDIIRKHMNDGWIPVEERLPERRVRYVWIAVDHGTIWQRMLAKWDGKNFKSIYGAEFHCKIIAWQECKTPEPYRPERSEGE